MTAAALTLVSVLTLGLQVAAAAAASEESGSRDLRSWELLDLDCSSELGFHRMTLFANGTVRIKTSEGETERMTLRELAPERLTGYLNRLRQEDLSESESSARSASGDWVEICELTLELEDGQFQSFRFGRFDSVDLALSHIVQIAGEITVWAEKELVVTDFPRGYKPKPGDVLKRKDGLLFEVVALTSDKRGVELRGVNQPLVIYVLGEELIGEFVSVVERRPLR